MPLKDILVFIDDGDSNAERVNTAFGLASSHNARITGVTLSGMKPAHLKLSDKKALARHAEEAAQKIASDFLEAAEKEGIDAKARVIHGENTQASRELAKYARNFDLVILRQANPKNRNFLLVEELAHQVVLLCGRPVFFMPYIGAHRIPCKKSMIAWDGTPTATRAVHDSLPLIKNINEVIILVIQTDLKKVAKGEPLADDLAEHLQRHGVNAVVRRVTAGTFDAQTVLLNELAENDIDLLVMGGYGTPSLKQKIFGGVTKTMLSSMITPVFMSH